MTVKAAYATLLTRSSYLPGVLVLDRCLQAVKSKYPLVVMITPSLPVEAKDLLDKRGLKTHHVETLLPDENFNRTAHKISEHDARFKDTWTKLRSVPFNLHHISQ